MVYQNLQGKHFLQTWGSSQQWVKACLSPKIKYPVIEKSLDTMKQTGWEIYIYKEDYIKKAEELLNEPTYRTISSDPTTKYKNKLINLLKTIKTDGGMNEALYRRLYPTGAGSPKFCGLLKIHKEGIPLRPIVSSIGTVSYETPMS